MESQTPNKELARVRALIEKAAASAGGQNALARQIGYDKATVSSWATGRDLCPAKAQAAMAHIAGLEAIEVMALATIEHERNPARKEALIKALGKHFAPLGAVVFFASFVAAALAPSDTRAMGLALDDV